MLGIHAHLIRAAITPLSQVVEAGILLITPANLFQGTGKFSELFEHFKAMAAIKWDDTVKLFFLCVQLLVGEAQTVYGCLPTSERELCQAEEIKALKGHFKTEALKECI